MQGQGQNKSLSVYTDAGRVCIDGQWFNTVIIGNQRWITADYTNLIEFPDDMSLWTAPENFRGRFGNDDKDLPLFDQFRTTVGKGVKTRYYVYKSAMYLDSLLQNGELVERDNLVGQYVATDTWHIPSFEEEGVLVGNLSVAEQIHYLNLEVTGHWYHEVVLTRNSSTKKWESDIFKHLMATNSSCHWNRDFIPNNQTGGGLYGTWCITAVDKETYNPIRTFYHQDLEPILPIRLVQTVAYKSKASTK